MKLIILLFCSLLTIKSASAENILFYWGVSGYSHRISVWPLIEKLVEKGHNVTFFSAFPPKKPNPLVTEITREHLFRDLNLDIDLLNVRLQEGAEGVDKLWLSYVSFGINHCNSVFSNPELVDWINHSSYDLIVINAFFNDCAYGLTHKFKAPHILYGTTSAFGYWSEAFGYPDENYPEFTLHYPLDMNFLQSVWNALRPIYWHWNRHYLMFPIIEETLKKGLKLNDIPSLAEIERNASLILMNTHYSQEYSRSLPPLYVEIGGMHCSNETKPLPEDINEFIESGDQGFMYFSFGTLVKTGNLPPNMQDIIFGAMQRSKTKFLVRWDGDLPKGLSENIKVVEWISQQDVLANPKIRGFISHGGLMGTQEATFHGVPMIVLPIFADQDYNAGVVRDRKRGIQLEFSELTQKQLEDAITEILNNKIYMENSKKVSLLFRDRQVEPAETAVWWVEYVLRNKDTSHLRPIGITKTWYQRRMLDIWGFFTLIFIGVLILIILVTGYLTKRISKFKKTSIRVSKKIN